MGICLTQKRKKEAPVQSPQGPVWLLNPAAPELVHPMPYSGLVKLTGKELAYPYPCFVEENAVAIEPQVVPAMAEWVSGIGPNEIYWLKVRLSEGDRWISPSHPVWMDYKEMKETITLPTDAKFFSEPFVIPDGVMVYLDNSKSLLKAVRMRPSKLPATGCTSVRKGRLKTERSGITSMASALTSG